MPQKLPRNIARQVKKTIAAIEKKEEVNQEEKPEVQVAFDQINDQTFRKIDPNYKQYYEQQKEKYLDVHPEIEEESDDTTFGYTVFIPNAPGTMVDILSPEYPRVAAKNLNINQIKLQKMRPIITVSSSDDIDVLSRLKIIKNPTAMQQAIKDKVIWMLPDGKIIPVNSDCKSVQQAIIDANLEQQKKKTDKPKESDEEFFRKLKKYLIIGAICVVLFLIGYFFLQTKFFNYTFGGRNLNSLYERLGVTKNATTEELKKAYRKLALEFHPDRNPNCTDCTDKFNKIADAYKTLLESREEKNIPTLIDEDNKWITKQEARAKK